MNGAVEAANKNVKKIIQKMVVTYKDWHRSPNLNRSHPVHVGIWNGGDDAFRSGNPLIESIDRL
jgi:hypothetical protein